MSTPVLAQQVTATWPSWINSNFILGIIVTIFTIIVCWSLVKTAPDAQRQNTGKLASGLGNILLVAIAFLLVITGAVFSIGRDTISQVFNGDSGIVQQPGQGGETE